MRVNSFGQHGFAAYCGESTLFAISSILDALGYVHTIHHSHSHHLDAFAQFYLEVVLYLVLKRPHFNMIFRIPRSYHYDLDKAAKLVIGQMEVKVAFLYTLVVRRRCFFHGCI